jgi:thiol-disulfide isomerase/thioredoxin
VHKIVLICGLSVFFFLAALAGEGPWSISPEKPVAGQKVVLTYDAGSRKAALSAAGEITGEVLLIPGKGLPELVEVPLSKEGTSWSGTFVVPEGKACLLAFRFTSGDLVDDNGKNAWSALVYSADGKPVRNAHYMKTFFLMGMAMGEFKHDKDVEGAKAEARAEKAAYPDNVGAWGFLWSQQLRESPGDSTVARIRKELEALYELKKNDAEEAPNFVGWFGRTGQQDRATKLQDAMVTKDPRGPLARSAAEQALVTERDPRKRIAAIDAFMSFYTLTEAERDNYLSRVAATYSSMGNYRAADSVVSVTKHPNAMVYNNIAWTILEKKGSPAEAAEYARKGIALVRASDVSAKPGYWNLRTWNKANRQNLAYILDTYGLALHRMKKPGEALEAYREADTLLEERDMGMVERMVTAAEDIGKPDQVIALAEKSIRGGMSSDSIMAMYGRAYVALHGAGADPKKTIADLKESAARDLREALGKTRLSKPAPAFEVKGLDGKNVSLASLKGKVVVLDFWATWCGPCKISMPFLQKTYEKYRADARVAFFAVDVWEQQTGDQLNALVSSFITQNKYTFPILLGGDLAEKFGVEGIPTKFVLDGEGKIAFKGVGAEGEEMVAKLSSQIDYLLGGQ